MKKLSATYKGLITGTVMVLISIGIFYFKGNFENNLQYITYFVYIAGIVWSLIDFKRSDAESKTFKKYFSEGFRCFVVVTFMMVAFTWIFLKLNPALINEMSRHTREELVKSGNKTGQEVDTLVSSAKQYYITVLTSMAIFGYLFIGALVTLIASAFLSQQKKM
ncbi:MAG: DUF4199 domain-containing protein [Ferruginibacter sp.]